MVHWIIHEKLQESGLSFHPQTGAPWTKSRRPSAAACYYFVQYVHHSHFPLLGSLGDADVTLAEMKRLKSAGGAGVTKVLRTRVSPIAQLYVDDCMPNAYEIQAIRRATAVTPETPNNVPVPSPAPQQSPADDVPALSASSPLSIEPSVVVNDVLTTAETQPRRRSSRLNTTMSSRWGVGTKVASEFDGEIFIGSVTRILPATIEGDEQLWHVVYEDSDQEDLNEKEMECARHLYVDGVSREDIDEVSDSEDDEYQPLA